MIGCKDCSAFVAVEGEKTVAGVPIGHCRRHAPAAVSFMPGQVDGFFPLVNEQWWCLEFVKKPLTGKNKKA